MGSFIRIRFRMKWLRFFESTMSTAAKREPEFQPQPFCASGANGSPKIHGHKPGGFIFTSYLTVPVPLTKFTSFNAVRLYKPMRYCFDQEEAVSIDPLPAKRRCILDSAGAKCSRTMEGGLTCTTKGPRRPTWLKQTASFLQRKGIEGALPELITNGDDRGNEIQPAAVAVWTVTAKLYNSKGIK